MKNSALKDPPHWARVVSPVTSVHGKSCRERKGIDPSSNFTALYGEMAVHCVHVDIDVIVRNLTVACGGWVSNSRKYDFTYRPLKQFCPVLLPVSPFCIYLKSSSNYLCLGILVYHIIRFGLKPRTTSAVWAPQMDLPYLRVASTAHLSTQLPMEVTALMVYAQILLASSPSPSLELAANFLAMRPAQRSSGRCARRAEAHGRPFRRIDSIPKPFTTRKERSRLQWVNSDDRISGLLRLTEMRRQMSRGDIF